MYIDSEMKSRAEGYLDAMYAVADHSAVIRAMYDGAIGAIIELGLRAANDDGTHEIGEIEI